MSQCPKCNYENPDNATHCGLCGEVFVKDQEPEFDRRFEPPISRSPKPTRPSASRWLKPGLILIIVIALLGYWLYPGPAPTPSSKPPATINIKTGPYQEGLSATETYKKEISGYTYIMTPLASYELHGRVAHKKKYRWDWKALIAPFDLAIIWGGLTDEACRKGISYSQSSRWYYFKYKAGFPYGESYILNCSSNSHIVPANDNLYRALYRVREGDEVILKGELIKIDVTKGNAVYWWHSSLSRTDLGNGSCEVLYLKQLQIGEQVYE